jgi:tryptophan synthase alpha chain
MAEEQLQTASSAPSPGGTGSGLPRIAAAFDAARAEGRAALMPYLMSGFPDPEASRVVARAYRDAGADLVEVGVPFSDPLADGPVIHAAATRALAAGGGFQSALEACQELGDGVPAVVMCYANMVLALGPRRFAGRIAEAGAAGAIVPDLPLEEAGEIRAALEERALALVPLLAPTTPAERRLRICEAARGFVYVVSDVGVTGERDELPADLAELLRTVRAEASVPVAVGFGIGTPRQAAAAGRDADGVIIGSRLVRMAESEPETIVPFLRSVREAMVAG